MGDNASLGALIAKYDSNIQILRRYYLLLLPANGFGFEESRNTYSTCSCSSYYYFPLSQVFVMTCRSQSSMAGWSLPLPCKGGMCAHIEVDLHVTRIVMFP